MRNRRQKNLPIKTYNLDHIADVGHISDKAWMGAHDMTQLDFSVAMFAGPGLNNVLRNSSKEVIKNIQFNSSGVEITSSEEFQEDLKTLSELHRAFTKMIAVCKRAYPLDYSYESIQAFLADQDYFEGMDHYQERQRLHPAVMSAKVIDVIVHQNRVNFCATGGKVSSFWDLKMIQTKKEEIFRRVYKCFNIQKKHLPPPGNQKSGTEDGASQASGNRGRGKNANNYNKKSQDQSRRPNNNNASNGGNGGNGGNRSRPNNKNTNFWYTSPICHSWNLNQCENQDERVCMRNGRPHIHGCEKPIGQNKQCRQGHFTKDHDAASNNST